MYKEKENQIGTGFKQFFFQVTQEEMENKSIYNKIMKKSQFCQIFEMLKILKH